MTLRSISFAPELVGMLHSTPARLQELKHVPILMQSMLESSDWRQHMDAQRRAWVRRLANSDNSVLRPVQLQALHEYVNASFVGVSTK